MRSHKLNEEQASGMPPNGIEMGHQLERRRLAVLLEALERRRKERQDELREIVPGRVVEWVYRQVLGELTGGLAGALAPALWTGALVADAVRWMAPPAVPERSGAGGSLATIIILNYQGRELLERNLPSVLAAVAASGAEHEVLVVDNGSTDGSMELVRDSFPTVRWLGLDRNYFFSAGNNAGVRVASNDLIVLLNNDMRVEPDFLAPLLAPFSESHDVFAVASQIFFSKPGKRREETGLTSAHFADGWIHLGHAQPSSFLRSEPVATFWAGGGACAFDRRKYNDLGGLDVLYDPFYCEDADLSFRAWQNGWRVLFAPRSIVHHEHRSTSSRVFGEKYVNETFRRNHFLLHWANLDPDLLAQHLVHLPGAVAGQVRREGWSGAKSFLRAMRRAPRAIARRARARLPGPSDREILDIAATVGAVEGSRPPKHLPADKPLKIVVVTPYAFYPPAHGGAVFTYNLVRGLAGRGHEVSVLGFVDTEDERDAQSGHLARFCREVHLRTRGTGTRRPDPLHLLPAGVREFDQLEFRADLRQLLDRLDPDVLHVEYTHMASYFSGSTRRINTISEHDVAFLSAYRRARVGGGLRERAHLHLDYLRMFRFETSMLRAFDLVFATGPKEAELLSSFKGLEHRVSNVPFAGMDLSRFACPPETRPASNELLFVGSFRHAPNVDALLYFVRDILPLVHRSRPDARLVVVGNGVPPKVLALGNDPRIEFRGFVEDLQPLYQRCAAFIAPIRVGAGIRVKLLEAFAAGAPAVSTTLGAEGIGAAHGRELLIADQPRDFAAAVLRLLSDPCAGIEMSQRAYELVGRFGIGSVAERLETEFCRALLKKRVMVT
jgi:GT2 family glycosyltransferase/glycosyltransferase involved in cell wall biosynthesis